MDSDTTLLQRYATSRDAYAFAELARRYRSMVYSVARRVTGNAHDAEDVAQSCFIQLASQAGTINASVPGWLHTAAVRIGSNINRDAVRRRRREQARAELTNEEDTAAMRGTWASVGPQVDAALEKLPEDFRVPLILHFLQDRTQVEIAEELNVSRATIARRLADGVERLRENLGRMGAVVSVFSLVTFMQAHAVQAAPPSLIADLGRMAIAGIHDPVAVAAPVKTVSVGGSGLSGLWFAQLVAKFAFPSKAVIASILGVVVTLGIVTKVSGIVGGEQPYDVVKSAFSPYMDQSDPLAFPIKSVSLSDSVFKFWRGSKDLYYRWAKTHTADWLADDGAYVVSHGDLHPGNIGTYATGPNQLAFGLVDYDDATRLPFQLELVHGLVSFHLAASDAGINVDASQRTKLDAAILDAYTAALISRDKADSAIRTDPIVAKLLSATKAPLADELKDYVGGDGKFVPAVVTKSGKVKEILRPAGDRADAFAAAITDALSKQPTMARAFRVTDVASIRQSIKSIALRTRIGSSGSQGLKKYFVLMASPLKDHDGDVILYLKQQVPSAAERAGIVPKSVDTPAQRCVSAMLATLPQTPWVCGSVEVNGESYWASIKEPWSEELEVEEAKSFDDLLSLARLWGTVAGGAHRRAAVDVNALVTRLTPATRQQVIERATAYEQHLTENFLAFAADPRVTKDRKTVDTAVESARGEAQANIYQGNTK